jgi:predicted glycosyltransferase
MPGSRTGGTFPPSRSRTSPLRGQPRFLFYSHDGVGLGHIRRNLAIAAALTHAAPEASVLLVTGCQELGGHGLAPNVDVLTLPGIKKLQNGRYSARRLTMSGSDIRALRSAQIEAAVETFRPDVMLVDKHPLGVRDELRGSLDALLEAGGRAVLGLRDVLDEPGVVRREWAAGNVLEAAEDYFERVLIYGDRRVLDFITEYELPRSLAERCRYCGYVVHPGAAGTVAVDALPAFATRLTRRPVVLATAGGGEDGAHLLGNFVQAAQDASWDAAVVAGPQLSSTERHALRRRAIEAGIDFHRTAVDVSSWFAHADALVSMAGYNTISEAVSRGTPTVCVPRVHPRSEQLIRARSFAQLELVRLVEPDRLDPRVLRREVASLLGTDRGRQTEKARAALQFDGARCAATQLLEIAASVTASSARGWRGFARGGLRAAAERM